RREEVREQLRGDEAAIDLVCDSARDAVRGSDLVILAMPTGVMADVVSAIEAEDLVEGVLFTDVGSVKESVLKEVAPLVEEKGGCFIGSHPMAGSEKVGLENAEKALFKGASVILTPSHAEKENTPELERLTRFWESLGGIVSVRSASEHDGIVASISHLPHLVAAALVRSVLKEGADLAAFCGGGFRDTTRVAGGPEEMWSGILTDNQPAVLDQLEQLIEELESWKEALDHLDREQLRAFLSESRVLRESL
ncbi:MAG: prephenate dehydrogenase/arogenate dehydrogenase family protein, partial [Verrucomicrobiota bacterium]